MHERLLDNIVSMKGELDLAIDDYTNAVEFKFILTTEIFSKKVNEVPSIFRIIGLDSLSKPAPPEERNS